jgi:hypothetical protein
MKNPLKKSNIRSVNIKFRSAKTENPLDKNGKSAQ